MSGGCGCSVLGWEDRVHIVTREAVRGADHIGGFNRTAGQEKNGDKDGGTK